MPRADTLRLLLIAAFVAALFFAGKKMTAQWKESLNAKKYLPLFVEVENRYGIPRDLLARVGYQESRFRDDIITGKVTSPAGAQGIMQIVPRWHPGINPLDPVESINYAGNYLAQLKRQFGSWKLALAAYNWGPGNLSQNYSTYGINAPDTWPMETRNYVAQITADVPVV